jgi:exodeoxyribonuclease VII small subunit
MTPPKKTPENFETALQELEEIVAKLESQELPLEDSLTLFEKGIRLSKICSKKLTEAEKKVELLVQELSKENPTDGVKE